MSRCSITTLSRLRHGGPSDRRGSKVRGRVWMMRVPYVLITEIAHHRRRGRWRATRLSSRHGLVPVHYGLGLFKICPFHVMVAGGDTPISICLSRAKSIGDIAPLRLMSK